jgi:hypothetical protein
MWKIYAGTYQAEPVSRNGGSAMLLRNVVEETSDGDDGDLLLLFGSGVSAAKHVSRTVLCKLKGRTNFAVNGPLVKTE